MQTITDDQPIADPDLFGPLLLDTGILLLRSGASSNRINQIVHRMAGAYHHIPHLDIGPKSISLSLQQTNGNKTFNGTLHTPDYGVNFQLLSGIYMMSEAVAKQQWPATAIQTELNRLKTLPHYPRWLILIAVACAGASFCRIFGGGIVEMAIVLGATFSGLFVKQELIKKSVNTYICTFISALVAALFTGGLYKAGISPHPEHAYATCILFLVPGVPLLNFFIDMIAGNIIYGFERGINAFIHIMSIALALAAVVYIYRFQL